MYKRPLNIGTLAGIVGFILFLACYAIGFSPLFLGRFVGFWVPIVAIIWANLTVRDQELGRVMTYGQAILTGMITVLVWASFKGFCIYIFMTLSDQHVVDQFVQSVDNYYQFFERTLGESLEGKPDLDSMAKELNPWTTMLNDINSNTLYGIFLCFIISFITKKTPKI